MTHKNERILSVAELARVEGEGALYVRTSGGKVEEARLDIYEPPRFFEAFLRGRAYTEPPDITARICGICPVAYQMSACLAIEEACGVTVDGPVARRCAGCCTAGSGSRATGCTSTCCTRPISSATAAGSRWPRSGATSWSAAWR